MRSRSSVARSRETRRQSSSLGLGGTVMAQTRGSPRCQAISVRSSLSPSIVYAAGDAAAKGPPLTPVSSHDAKVVAANLLEGNRHRPDYRGVPSVAFTLPPIAAVGLGEAEARAAGL